MSQKRSGKFEKRESSLPCRDSKHDSWDIQLVAQSLYRPKHFVQIQDSRKPDSQLRVWLAYMENSPVRKSNAEDTTSGLRGLWTLPNAWCSRKNTFTEAKYFPSQGKMLEMLYSLGSHPVEGITLFHWTAWVSLITSIYVSTIRFCRRETVM